MKDDRPPAGWYRVSTDLIRYWDGNTWQTSDSDIDWLRDENETPVDPPRISDAIATPAKSPRSAKTQKDSVRRMRQVWTAGAIVLVAVLAAVLVAIRATESTGPEATESIPSHEPTPTASSTQYTPVIPSPSKPTKQPTAAAYLYLTDQKDGDSFVATDGIEYRLGLVNAPDAGEPCALEASAFTRSYLQRGFVADAYATDQYGRRVAEIRDPLGNSLNVALAESGLGNDRYLSAFRHENTDLADRLDAAFAVADEPACLGATSSAR